MAINDAHTTAIIFIDTCYNVCFTSHHFAFMPKYIYTPHVIITASVAAIKCQNCNRTHRQKGHQRETKCKQHVCAGRMILFEPAYTNRFKFATRWDQLEIFPRILNECTANYIRMIAPISIRAHTAWTWIAKTSTKINAQIANTKVSRILK